MKLLPALIVLGFLNVAHAETSAEALKRGNTLYGEGKFAEAVDAYQMARQTGLHHWVLYYNLGNAQFKTGQLGRAIADYLQAFRLNSGNSDVLHNLRLASARAGDPVVPESALPALGWRLFYRISVNTLTVLASVLFLFLSAVGVVSLGVLPTRWRFQGWRLPVELIQGASVTFAVLLLWLGIRIYVQTKPIGIVVGGVAEVRSGPSTTYPASFTVPEGRRVLILKEQEPIAGWLEVGVPQEGLKGWIPDSAIEIPNAF